MRKLSPPRLRLVIAAAVLWCGPSSRAADVPRSLDAAVIRAMPVQRDGRYPPLDTVARDIVESVTGQVFYRGHDPVLVLLAWTFDPQTWMSEPLIPIPNAELRRELELPPSQTVFSFADLVEHARLRDLIESLADIERGRKLNPLESKVSNIHEKLNLLSEVFRGRVIRPIPDPAEANGDWRATAVLIRDESEELRQVREAWAAVGRAILADDAAAFASASDRLVAALAALPAAHSVNRELIATELRYNRLHPFRTAWIVMMVGAVVAGLALAVRRRWLDAVAAGVMLAGFAVLTCGLWLRWQIAGRIPASNMFESLLFLSWGMGAFAIVSMWVVRDRVVPLTASGMGALALFLADVVPLDHYVRPIVPVLNDTIWMSIHVPIIMVSYSVLALAVLIAHAQILIVAVAPARRRLIASIDMLHYWYVHVGAILLLAGIVTGSMWAASSWGRYWGWDPKEVWSLIAFLGYVTILHVRLDRDAVPKWAYGVAALLGVGLFVIVVPKIVSPGNPAAMAVEIMGLAGAGAVMVLFVVARGQLATAVKSIAAFWLIIMTYLGVNYVLGTGLHSYGFGTGAVVRYLFLVGGIDLLLVVVCCGVYLARRGGSSRPSPGPVAPALRRSESGLQG